MNSYAYKRCMACARDLYTNDDYCDCGGQLFLDIDRLKEEHVLDEE